MLPRLHVYAVGHFSNLQRLPSPTQGVLGEGAVFHGAVEVHGDVVGARQDRLEVALQHARAVAEVQKTKRAINR